MSEVASRNPWPCARCSAPIELAPRAGRLPRAAVASGLTFLALLVLGLARYRAGGADWRWAVALLGLALATKLSVFRRGRDAWACPRCASRTQARLRHAGRASFLVAIPTYNNRGSIADVIRRVAAAAPDLPLVVVDDGSTDGTGEAARAALAERAPEQPSWLLRHAQNQGKGAAILTALRQALRERHSHVITLDADGQHKPEDVPKLRQAALDHPTAIVVGARDLSAESVETVSRFGRSFSNFWLRVQTGVKLADSQSGFRVYPVAPTLSLGLRAKAYDLEVEVLTLAPRAGMPLVSTPIDVHYPPASERVSHFDRLWDNVRISWVNTRLLHALPLWLIGWPARLSSDPPPPTTPRAWSGKSRGGALGHLIFLWVLRLLGPGPAYALLYPVALYFMFASRPAVRESQRFLDRSRGPAPNAWSRFWRSYRHLLTFAQCILDRAIVSVRGDRDFTRTEQGREHLLPKDGRGLLLLSAHLGNYEVAGALLHADALPINVVMLDAEVEAIKAIHERFGRPQGLPKIIATNAGEFPALEVLRALRAGEAVALHADRVIDNRWVWCDFLGRKAPFPTGVFLIAAAAKVPVVLTFGFKDGRRHYSFVAEPPIEITIPRTHRDEALGMWARWYANRLEAYARRYPWQWFNFYDFWQAPANASTAGSELPQLASILSTKS